MKQITKIFLCVCVFALTLLCAAGCAPGSFDIEGTSRELRLNGFVYRSLEGAQATGNYYTDSFANSFLPFLVRDYDTITVLDLRLYREGVQPLADQADDVLVLYELTNFASDKNLYKLNKT